MKEDLIQKHKAAGSRIAQLTCYGRPYSSASAACFGHSRATKTEPEQGNNLGSSASHYDDHFKMLKSSPSYALLFQTLDLEAQALNQAIAALQQAPPRSMIADRKRAIYASETQPSKQNCQIHP